MPRIQVEGIINVDHSHKPCLVLFRTILVGVPQYRISQMVKNGGNILDAFGIVDVVSPCGLPIRGIIGIRPDPIMFIALNCQDVKVVKSFYEQLGFVEQVKNPFCTTHSTMIHSLN
mmetsp:Transcript_49979/g.150336  ORF Transcript_49979/g.150336 Transcript_49979/m.150336 type:complete len:116 (-) Transcript_49979:748-1095(-)